MPVGHGPRCGAITATRKPCTRPAVNGRPCLWHDPARKPDGHRWPLPRRWTLMGLVEHGWDDARIGKALGCTPDAAKMARRRYRIAPKSRVCLTARQVAARLGLSCAKKVVVWIERGWLRGRHGWKQGAHRTWIVREEALLAFLADPAHFHRYDPAHIVDCTWRVWAERHRGGERFLSQTESAAWLCSERGICVVRETIGNWFNKGRLPFVRDGRGNRQVRLSDLQAFEQPLLGQGSLKRAWDPCVFCGDPDGPIGRGCRTPARRQGDRFGTKGLLCSRCHRRARAKFEQAAALGAAA